MKTTLFRSSLVLLLLFIMLSCEREETSINQEVLKSSDVMSAKRWFEENEPNLTSLKGILPSSGANLENISKKPDWESALVHKTKDGKKIIEVKLNYDKHILFSNKDNPQFPNRPNVLNSLLLFEHQLGKYNVFILKTYPEDPYTPLSEADFERINYGSVSNDFSGSMMMFDWKENFVGGWQVKDGILHKYIIRDDSKTSKKGFSSTFNASWNCRNVETQWYVLECNKEGCKWTYSHSTWEYLCEEQPDKGGGGGGGGGKCMIQHPCIEGESIECNKYPDANCPESKCDSAPITSTYDPICKGDANPVFTATGNNLRWYAGSVSEANLVGTGDSYTSTKTTAGNYIYYVTQQVEGCGESKASKISLTIIGVPEAPLLRKNEYSACEGNANPIFTATGNNLRWYAGRVSEANLVGTGDSYTSTKTTAGNYIYNVTQSSACGESTASTISFTIKSSSDCTQPPADDDLYTG